MPASLWHDFPARWREAYGPSTCGCVPLASWEGYLMHTTTHPVDLPRAFGMCPYCHGTGQDQRLVTHSYVPHA